MGVWSGCELLTSTVFFHQSSGFPSCSYVSQGRAPHGTLQYVYTTESSPVHLSPLFHLCTTLTASILMPVVLIIYLLTSSRLIFIVLKILKNESQSFILKVLFFFDICPFVCEIHFKNIFKDNVIHYNLRIKEKVRAFQLIQTSTWQNSTSSNQILNKLGTDESPFTSWMAYMKKPQHTCSQ